MPSRPTVYELAQSFRRPGGKADTYRITPKPFHINGRFREAVDPAELASLVVPIISIEDNDIKGYQRDPRDRKSAIEREATALREGHDIPTIEVSVVNGVAEVTDGAGRSVACVLARKPADVRCVQRDSEGAAAFFADQRAGQRVSASLLILRGRDPYDLYIRDAVVNPDHRWNHFVSKNGSKTTISPAQAKALLVIYAGNRLTTHPPITKGVPGVFDRDRADDLIGLLNAFGRKGRHPWAFEDSYIRALTLTAAMVFPSNPRNAANVARWARHMPNFDYESAMPYKGAAARWQLLVNHWNYKLPKARRLKIPEAL